MSTETQPDAAPPAKSKKIALIVVVVLGVVIGGGAGAFVAAPLLAGKVAPAKAASAVEEDSAASEGDVHGKGGAKVVHMVDNLVLNPARSGGARFLLLSVGLGVKDEATAKTLADRDPELRDVVLRYMGARTIEELADVTLRDSLKVQLRAAVTERFGAGAVSEVYFPQFVIQ